MKRYFVTLLALVLALTMIPMAASAAAPSADGGNAVYGNGAALTIEAASYAVGSGWTAANSAVSADKAGALVWWNEGGATVYVYVSNRADIFGGAANGALQSNTSVRMNGGTVGAIYGGCSVGRMTGNTNVLLYGGRVNAVYGGGLNGSIKGSTNVFVGGNAVVDKVYGGCRNEIVTGDTLVTVSDSAKVSTVFAGGDYSASEVRGTSRLWVSGGLVTDAYAGANVAATSASTWAAVTGGRVVLLNLGGAESPNAPAASTLWLVGGAVVGVELPENDLTLYAGATTDTRTWSGKPKISFYPLVDDETETPAAEKTFNSTMMTFQINNLPKDSFRIVTPEGVTCAGTLTTPNGLYYAAEGASVKLTADGGVAGGSYICGGKEYAFTGDSFTMPNGAVTGLKVELTDGSTAGEQETETTAADDDANPNTGIRSRVSF